MRPSIRTRILTAFLASFVLFLGALVYGVAQLQALGEGIRLVNEGYLPLARITSQIQAHQGRLDLDASRLQRDSGRPLAAFRSNVSLHASAIKSVVSQGSSTASRALEFTEHPEERLALEIALAQLERLGAMAADYETANRTWVQEAQGGDEAAERAAQGEILRRQKEIQTLVKQLDANLEGSIRRVNHRVAGTQARATMVGGGLTAAALIFGVVMLGWALVTMRPIVRLTVEAQRVAAGDYSGRVVVRGRDEVGLLAEEFNNMARSIAERDRRLVERAEELKKLSSYLKSVLDSIRSGVVVTEGSHVAMLNQPAARLLGVEEGRPLPAPLRAFSPGRYEGIHLNQRRFDLEVIPFGQRGSLVVAEDVTERLEAQERLKQSERLALVGQMLAQVIHEVRNPLNAMSLNAELLVEEVETLDQERRTDAAGILKVIVGEIRRLEEVTEHYLDLARPRQPTLHPEDVNELVRSVCRLEEAAFQEQGVTLAVETPAESVEVPLDGNRFRRALLNILRNAMFSGGGDVRVRVSPTPQAVEITVTDDGPGMDDATMVRAFDPFFSSRPGGTGLGLAITRQIVEDHGGRVSFQQQDGDGFQVTLSFPMA